MLNVEIQKWPTEEGGVGKRDPQRNLGFLRVILSQRLKCNQVLAQVLSPQLWVRPISNDNQASSETLTFNASSCPQFQEKEGWRVKNKAETQSIERQWPHTKDALVSVGIQSPDSRAHSFPILSHTGNYISEANFDYMWNLT